MSSRVTGQQLKDKVLIIGSTGLLGGALLRRLSPMSLRIEVLNRRLEAWSDRPQYLLEDLETLSEDYSAVFLLASHVPYGAMDSFTYELHKANVQLVTRIVTKFANSRLVFASSVSVYGTPRIVPIDEEHPFSGCSAYGLSKLAGEFSVQCHPNSVCLRFSSLYGPGMTQPTFITKIVESTRKHRHIVLHGDGSRKQDYLHITDAAELLWKASVSTQIGCFNAVSGQSFSNRFVAEIVAEEVPGVTISYHGVDNAPSWVFSSKKVTTAFSWEPSVSFAAGLRELVHCG